MRILLSSCRGPHRFLRLFLWRLGGTPLAWPVAAAARERVLLIPCLADWSMRLLPQGSGGMIFVDPAFQRALVAEARARGIPVIFDEVPISVLTMQNSLEPLNLPSLNLPDVLCCGPQLMLSLCQAVLKRCGATCVTRLAVCGCMLLSPPLDNVPGPPSTGVFGAVAPGRCLRCTAAGHAAGHRLLRQAADRCGFSRPASATLADLHPQDRHSLALTSCLKPSEVRPLYLMMQRCIVWPKEGHHQCAALLPSLKSGGVSLEAPHISYNATCRWPAAAGGDAGV